MVMIAAFFITAFASSLFAEMVPKPAGLDWPQWRGVNRDGIWQERGLIGRFTNSEIAIKWRVPISNGYSGPTVAEGRVYVTDYVSTPKPQERVHCFDWETGRTLWSYAYDVRYGGVGYPNGPRASVTIHEGRVYALGAVGHLFCLHAATGRVLWSKDLDKEYHIRMPEWGIAAAPLIEGNLVIVQLGGSNGACLVAFDKVRGQERWRALEDRASYSAPIVIQQAGQRVLICLTGERVVGLNPYTGEVYWAYPFPPRLWPIGIATPVVQGDKLFITSAIDGALMLRLLPDRLSVEKLWQRRGQNEINTDALHCLISTPFIEGNYIYGIDHYGELRCLDARTGDRLWESRDVVPRARWATAHLVRNGERVWIFNERGQLIISRMTPKGFEEISRAQLIKPTRGQLGDRGGVCWSHPAFAYGHVFARNDEELVCASLKVAD